MIENYEALLAPAEAAVEAGEYPVAWRQLRKLTLNDFGELLLEVPDKFPALKQWLPSMASDEVQRNWTGACGKPLLAQSLYFIQAVESAYREYTGNPLADSRVLDYGCGWGRLLRLMPYYMDPGQLYGVDPWDQSLELCRQHGCMANLALCDYVPTQLPFDIQFDLVYAYSVFTHLSEKTAAAILNLLHSHMTGNGLLVITVRPVHYWDVHTEWREGYSAAMLKKDHEERGFAFMPHYRMPVDGDITYGDASMTLDFIARRWPGWKVVGTDSNQSDPHQTIVFLQAV